MKSKKAITLGILIVLLIALTATYAALTASNRAREEREAEEAENADAGVPLYEVEVSDIVTISYEKDSESISITRSGDTWCLVEDEKFPLKQTTCDSIAEKIAGISSKRSVEDGDEADFGLDEPVMTAAFSTANGESYTVEFGDVNSFNSCTYIRYDGRVYMIDDELTSLCKTDRTKLIDITDSFPSAIDDESVTAIELTDENGNTNTVTDSDGMSDLLEKIESVVTFKTYAGYGLSEDELDEYGVGSDAFTAKIRYKTSDSSDSDTQLDAYFTVRFGSGVDSGYYYALPDGTMTYATNKEAFSEIAEYMDYTAPESESEETE